MSTHASLLSHWLGGSIAGELFPHEIVCGLLLLFLWLRLAWVAAFGRDIVFLSVMLAANVSIFAFWQAHPTSLRWRIRLLFYPLAMNLLYPMLRTIVPAIHPKLADAALEGIDHWLLGTNLSLELQRFITPSLTDLLSLCYLLYFVYLLFSQVWYFVGDLEILKRFYVGMFTIYGIGYFGYTLIPALGPYLAMSNQFSVALDGGWLTHLNARVVVAGSNRVDVFPSLHCANSLFMLLFDRRYRPWRFWLYLLPCVGFWISTIYLRYHYFVDLICGSPITLASQPCL